LPRTGDETSFEFRLAGWSTAQRAARLSRDLQVAVTMAPLAQAMDAGSAGAAEPDAGRSGPAVHVGERPEGQRGRQRDRRAEARDAAAPETGSGQAAKAPPRIRDLNVLHDPYAE
jgi:hypothetical protein